MNGEEFREQEIRRLAEEVLETALKYHVNDNRPDGWQCRFCCGNYKSYPQNESDFEHDLDCIYLEAKDLLSERAAKIKRCRDYEREGENEH